MRRKYTELSEFSEATERHYTPKELAVAWHVSTSYIRRRFRYEKGVMMLGRSMRIPKSVVERVHRQSGERAEMGAVRFAQHRQLQAEAARRERVPLDDSLSKGRKYFNSARRSRDDR